MYIRADAIAASILPRQAGAHQNKFIFAGRFTHETQIKYSAAYPYPPYKNYSRWKLDSDIDPSFISDRIGATNRTMKRRSLEQSQITYTMKRRCRCYTLKSTPALLLPSLCWFSLIRACFKVWRKVATAVACLYGRYSYKWIIASEVHLSEAPFIF